MMRLAALKIQPRGDWVRRKIIVLPLVIDFT
jgi:hypothetical protein